MLQTSRGGLHPTDLLATFFSAAIAFLTLGLALITLNRAGLATGTEVGAWLAGSEAHWAAIHLIFLGGVSQLILGAAQFFCTAFLATDPPPKRVIEIQLALWNTGALLTVAGVVTEIPALNYAGALLLLGGLALFSRALIQLQRGSLQKARWAVRWYQACAACLAVGFLLGGLMVGGLHWSHGSLLGAHLTLNLAGWIGAAIVGTLHTFFPSLTQAPLAHPRLQAPTYLAWFGGTALLATGFGLGVSGLILAGWAGLALSAILLAFNLIGCLRVAKISLSPAARLIAFAQPFLVAGLASALYTAAFTGPAATLGPASRTRLALLLLAGWIGLTVLGSLIHLLGVLRHVRRLRRRMLGAMPSAKA